MFTLLTYNETYPGRAQARDPYILTRRPGCLPGCLREGAVVDVITSALQLDRRRLHFKRPSGRRLISVGARYTSGRIRSRMSSTIRTYVVEDQTLLRQSMIAILDGDEGIEVVGSSPDAEQALADLDSTAADVVLMDIRLPGMNGIAATRLLKARHDDLAVVVVTFHRDEHVTSAIEAGASGYILKTCTVDDLLRAVRMAHEGLTPIDPSVVAEVVSELAAYRKASRDTLLTERQTEILRLIAGGHRVKAIAEMLFVGDRTVSREIRNIFDRLGGNDAPHAVAEAYKMGLL